MRISDWSSDVCSSDLRVFIYTRHEVMTLTNLPPARQPGVTAIFVPVWDEAGVIGAMLHHCLTSWKDDAFRIFVGCYPNDPATISAVMAVAERDKIGRAHV